MTGKSEVMGRGRLFGDTGQKSAWGKCGASNGETGRPPRSPFLGTDPEPLLPDCPSLALHLAARL